MYGQNVKFLRIIAGRKYKQVTCEFEKVKDETYLHWIYFVI